MHQVTLYLFKQQPQLPLRLAHPLAEDIGTLPHEEGYLPVAMATLVGQRPGSQRLPGPRRSIKQTTSGERHRSVIRFTGNL